MGESVGDRVAGRLLLRRLLVRGVAGDIPRRQLARLIGLGHAVRMAELKEHGEKDPEHHPAAADDPDVVLQLISNFRRVPPFSVI